MIFKRKDFWKKMKKNKEGMKNMNGFQSICERRDEGEIVFVSTRRHEQKKERKEEEKNDFTNILSRGRKTTRFQAWMKKK